MSSIKSIIGHTNGAARVIEAVVFTLVKQGVPPTANLVQPDEEFGIDFVMGRGSPCASTCLNMSAGFGGANACLLLGRAP